MSLITGRVRLRTPRPLGMATIVVVVLCSGCSPRYDEMVALGTLERDRIELVAESSEPIIQVPVREGDVVEVGAVLLQQDTTRANIALAHARAEQATAQSGLTAAEAGPRQQQITAARARLEAAMSSEKTARSELQRELSLIERNLASQSGVDTLQGRVDETTARTQEIRAVLDELLEGTRSELIDQARSNHAAAHALVRDLEVTLERATIRAPISGQVEALPVEVGERPPQGSTVAVLLAGGRTYARVHLPHELRTQLAAGSRAEILLDGREPLPGRLRWVAASAAFTPYFALNQHDRSRLSYLAEIDLVEEDDSLPVGVPVEVSFPELGQ